MQRCRSLHNMPLETQKGSKATVLPMLKLDTTWGVGDQFHALAPLCMGKKPSVHCTGGWVDPSASLNRCEEEKIYCNHWGSNLKPSSP